MDGITVPLIAKNGLFIVGCRKPTVEEINSCMRLVLTSDQPWDVTAGGNNKDEVRVPTPIYEEDDFVGTYTMQSTKVHCVHSSISYTEQADFLTLQTKLA